MKESIGPRGRVAPRASKTGRPQTAPKTRFAIEIAGRTRESPLSAARLRQIARATLAAERVREAAISIALVDNREIRRLNRRHLKHDYATDVLSFLFESETIGPGSRRIDGEVVMSVEQARQSAPRFKMTPRDELALYLVHGLLHLCGHDDRTPRLRRAMRRREEAILTSLGIESSPSGQERDSK